MATPTLTKRRLPGVLGEILVDVRAGSRVEPGPAVIVLHGFKGFKDWGMFPPFAERLARAGFTAVSPNVSGSGVDDTGSFVWPERFGHNTFSAELADLGAVMEALDRGALSVARPTSVGIVGHSRGGGVAILAARLRPRLSALVSWAAVSTVVRWPEDQIETWRARGSIEITNARTGEILPMYTDTLDDVERNQSGSLDIRAAAASLSIPWLLVHGEVDESVSVAEADALARVAPEERTRLLKIPGAGHTFGAVHPFAGPTPALDQVFDESVAFLTRTLR